MLATIDFVDVGLSGAMLVCVAGMLLRWIRAGAAPKPPGELRALLMLSVSLAVVNLCAMILAPAAREQFISRYGDAGIPIVVVAMAVATLFVERKSGARLLLFGVMGFSALLCAVSQTGAVDDASDPLRKGSRMIVPLVCMAVLLSPRVKRYCSVGRSEALA